MIRKVDQKRVQNVHLSTVLEHLHNIERDLERVEEIVRSIERSRNVPPRPFTERVSLVCSFYGKPVLLVLGPGECTGLKVGTHRLSDSNMWLRLVTCYSKILDWDRFYRDEVKSTVCPVPVCAGLLVSLVPELRNQMNMLVDKFLNIVKKIREKGRAESRETFNVTNKWGRIWEVEHYVNLPVDEETMSILEEMRRLASGTRDLYVRALDYLPLLDMLL